MGNRQGPELKAQVNTSVFYRIVNVVFAALFFGIVLLSVFNNQSSAHTFSRPLLLLSAALGAVLVFGASRLFSLLPTPGKIAEIAALSGGMLVFAALCFVVGFSLAGTPDEASEFGMVFSRAVDYVQNGVLPDNYFLYYPTQKGFYVILSVFFSFLKALGVTDFMTPLVVINILSVCGAVLLMYFCARRLFGVKKALFLLAGSLFAVPFLLSGPVAHTYTITLPVPVAIILLWMKTRSCWRSGDGRKAILNFMLLSSLAAVGALIKMTVLVIYIAVLIDLLVLISMRGKLKLLGVGAGVCVAVYLLGMLAVNASSALPDYDTEADGIPLTSWIMMGLSENGADNQADLDLILQRTGQAERSAFVSQEIAERFGDYMPFGIFGHFGNKLAYTFGDPTLGLAQQLGTGGTGLRGLFLPGGSGFAAMSFLAFGLQMGVLAWAAVAAAKSLYRKNDALTFARLAMLGLVVFLLLWKTEPSEIVLFVPVFLLCSLEASPAPMLALQKRRAHEALQTGALSQGTALELAEPSFDEVQAITPEPEVPMKAEPEAAELPQMPEAVSAAGGQESFESGWNHEPAQADDDSLDLFPGQTVPDVQPEDDAFPILAAPEAQAEENWADQAIQEAFAQGYDVEYTTEDGQVFYQQPDGRTYYIAEDGQAYYYPQEGEAGYYDGTGQYYYPSGELYAQQVFVDTPDGQQVYYQDYYDLSSEPYWDEETQQWYVTQPVEEVPAAEEAYEYGSQWQRPVEGPEAAQLEWVEEASPDKADVLDTESPVEEAVSGEYEEEQPPAEAEAVEETASEITAEEPGEVSAEPEAGPALEPELGVLPEPEEVIPEAEIEAEPEPEAEAIPEAEVEAEPEPEAEAIPEAEAEAEPEPELTPELTLWPDVPELALAEEDLPESEAALELWPDEEAEQETEPAEVAAAREPLEPVVEEPLEAVETAAAEDTEPEETAFVAEMVPAAEVVEATELVEATEPLFAGEDAEIEDFEAETADEPKPALTPELTLWPELGPEELDGQQEILFGEEPGEAKVPAVLPLGEAQTAESADEYSRPARQADTGDVAASASEEEDYFFELPPVTELPEEEDVHEAGDVPPIFELFAEVETAEPADVEPAAVEMPADMGQEADVFAAPVFDVPEEESAADEPAAFDLFPEGEMFEEEWSGEEAIPELSVPDSYVEEETAEAEDRKLPLWLEVELEEALLKQSETAPEVDVDRLLQDAADVQEPQTPEPVPESAPPEFAEDEITLELEPVLDIPDEPVETVPDVLQMLDAELERVVTPETAEAGDSEPSAAEEAAAHAEPEALTWEASGEESPSEPEARPKISDEAVDDIIALLHIKRRQQEKRRQMEEATPAAAVEESRPEPVEFEPALVMHSEPKDQPEAVSEPVSVTEPVSEPAPEPVPEEAPADATADAMQEEMLMRALEFASGGQSFMPPAAQKQEVTASSAYEPVITASEPAEERPAEAPLTEETRAETSLEQNTAFVQDSVFEREADTAPKPSVVSQPVSRTVPPVVTIQPVVQPLRPLSPVPQPQHRPVVIQRVAPAPQYPAPPVDEVEAILQSLRKSAPPVHIAAVSPVQPQTAVRRAGQPASQPPPARPAAAPSARLSQSQPAHTVESVLRSLNQSAPQMSAGKTRPGGDASWDALHRAINSGLPEDRRYGVKRPTAYDELIKMVDHAKPEDTSR